MAEKTCRTCGSSRPLCEFDRAPKGRLGVLGTCKSCNKAKRLTKARTVVLVEKRCPRCTETKAITDFNVCNRNRDGRQVYCRPCGRAMAKSLANTRQVTEKTCPGCKALLIASAFSRSTAEPDGLQRYCRECNLRDRYGISVTEYRAMFTQQDGKCAICRRAGGDFGSGRRLSVDHDHETGKVRALLCGPCNSGLGLFRDDPATLIAASRYLEIHRYGGSIPVMQNVAGLWQIHRRAV